MPIYEYRRPDGTRFELLQSFSDDALTVDPDTGVPVERVLHAPALHFKGNGFYSTDYGTRNRERETAANGSSSSKDSSASDSSSKESSSGGDSSAGQSSGSSSESKTKSASDGEKGTKASKDSTKSKDSKPVTAKR